MSGQHTPGPWAIHPMFGDYIVPEPSKAKPIGASVVDNYDREYYAQTIARVHSDQANARLIAAAPDLLEALTAMTALCAVKYGNLDEGVWLEIQKARAAIAKARGLE